jgi:hypothetical protein
MEKCCHVENKFGIAKASLLEVQKVVKQHNMTDGEENDGPEINIREVGVYYFLHAFFSCSENLIYFRTFVFV